MNLRFDLSKQALWSRALALALCAPLGGCGGGDSSPAAAAGAGSGGSGAAAAGGSGGSSAGAGGSSAGAGGSGGVAGTGGSGGVALPPDSRCVPDDEQAPAVFVGASGDDKNPGTQDMPVRSFARALAIVGPGQDVRVLGGTYTEKLKVAKGGSADKPLRILAAKGEKVVLDATGSDAGKPIDVTGSFVLVQGFEVTGSVNQCVDASGTDIVLCRLEVHDCDSHGVQISGQRVWAEGNTIRGASLENEGGALGQSGWGSALKVKVGGEDITLTHNRLYHNWGEGVAVTRGKKVTVRENYAYDNFAVNFYVDNSIDVLVEKNLATCTANSGYERDGKRSNAYQIGEEYYDGWGAQLSGVTIRNNIAFSCNRGFLYPGSDVGGGLVDATIVHNTFWGNMDTGLSITHDAGTKGTIVHNNIVQQSGGKDVWIEDPAGVKVSHNLWVDGVPDDYTNGSGAGDVIGEPGFFKMLDYKAASFRLGEGSSARDAALDLAAVIDDFEGRQRHPASSKGADMGAMEFGDPAAACAFDALFGL